MYFMEYISEHKDRVFSMAAENSKSEDTMVYLYEEWEQGEGGEAIINFYE